VASLVSLQAQGGGRIPMDGFTYDVSRQDLVAILDAMPTTTCRALHLAVRQGDLASAQRLLREAAQSYFAATPAAPAPRALPTPPLTRHRRRPTRYS
jgi:hypothetical protein